MWIRFVFDSLTNDAVTILSVNLGGWLVTEPVSQHSINQ